ncbi:hypothetical protein ECANGB1_1888 [Enterospora canceri]|uniref:Uncharacterized protein n=1 Tax=Enterospora canceri TaxID=1081671 RepID=A0A1Y1SA65_9MICR|nr:hypothetical protein ECANGB1_1888 [Enterospora canceri]
MFSIVRFMAVLGAEEEIHLFSLWGDKGLKATGKEGAATGIVDHSEATEFAYTKSNKFVLTGARKYVLDWNRGNDSIISWTNNSHGDSNQKFRFEKALSDPRYLKVTDGRRCMTFNYSKNTVEFNQCNKSLEQVFLKKIRQATNTFLVYTKKGPHGIRAKLEVNTPIELVDPGKTESIYCDGSTTKVGLAYAQQSAFEFNSSTGEFVLKLESAGQVRQDVTCEMGVGNEFRLKHDGKCLTVDESKMRLVLEPCSDKIEQIFMKSLKEKEKDVGVVEPRAFKLTNRDNTRALKGIAESGEEIRVKNREEGTLWNEDKEAPSVDMKGGNYSMDYLEKAQTMGMWKKVPGAEDQRVTLEPDGNGLFYLKNKGLCGTFEGDVIKMRKCDGSAEQKFNKLTAEDEMALAKGSKANPETGGHHYDIHITGPGEEHVDGKNPTIHVDGSHTVKIKPSKDDSKEPEIVIEPMEGKEGVEEQPIAVAGVRELAVGENGLYGDLGRSGRPGSAMRPRRGVKGMREGDPSGRGSLNKAAEALGAANPLGKGTEKVSDPLDKATGAEKVAEITSKAGATNDKTPSTGSGMRKINKNANGAGNKETAGDNKNDGAKGRLRMDGRTGVSCTDDTCLNGHISPASDL